MSNNLLIPQSKLPSLGTTIFTQMNALTQQHQATNLSQGFPDFDGPLLLQECQAYHVAHGTSQYASMTGARPLREVIANETADLYGYKPDTNNEVTITAEATETLHATITALVRPGDEVICFDPSYDDYVPAVELSGGVVRHITLRSLSFCVDWRIFSTLLSSHTRLIILSTPHNPSATVRHRADFGALRRAIKESEIFVISDEIYEHICLARQGYANVLVHSELWEHATAISPFGKTYHMVGQKAEHCAMPAAISAKLRKVHQYLTLFVDTPVQLILADMLREDSVHYRKLPVFCQKEHDMLVNALRGSRLKILPREDTYFLLIDYSAVSSLGSVELCQWLTTGVGVVVVPLSASRADLLPYKLIRFCFTKQESTLLVAAERSVSL